MQEQAHSPEQNPHHARRWWILAVIGLAQLMVVLDVTIVNIALPSAQSDLGFSADDRQWVVTAYALAFGGLLLLGGRLGDLLGRKRTFLIGVTGFAGASALGGAAGSFDVLILARALQGVFGALLAPATLGLLTTTFADPKERAKAFGIFGAIAGTGGAIGLLLGGILTEYLSWRWSMYVNLVFAGAAAVGGFALLRNQVSAVRARIDIPGALTVSTGLVALVYGLSQAENRGWGDGVTLALFGAAAVLLAGFVLLQARVAKQPLLPLRVVTDRDRGGAFLAVAVVSAGLFGVFLFLTYYLQQTLEFSPIETGLAFLPLSAAAIAGSTQAATKLLPRVGARPVIPAGLLLGAAGMLYLTQVGIDSSYAGAVLPALLLLGLGIGMVMAPSIHTATVGVRPNDAGIASALVNTSQQIGGSIGTALLSTMFASAVTDQLAGTQPTAAALAEASVHGYTTAFWWAAAIFAAGAIVVGLLLRGGVRETAPGVEPALAH